jgi:hypothetical protein
MSGSTVGQSMKSDKELLVGSWTLISLTVGEGANQTLPYGPNPKGTMMVDANGRFSITVVRSDVPKVASNNRMTATPDENKAIVQGSIAYFGTYSIDEGTHVITVNVEGSTTEFQRRHADAYPVVRRQRGHLSQSDPVDGWRDCQGHLPARALNRSPIDRPREPDFGERRAEDRLFIHRAYPYPGRIAAKSSL